MGIRPVGEAERAARPPKHKVKPKPKPKLPPCYALVPRNLRPLNPG